MFVYSVTNTMDGMIYVGASQRSLSTRKSQHKSRASLCTKDSRYTPLYEAIRKYGWKVFEWRILERCKGAEALYIAEKKWIAHLESAATDKGYNLTLGGLGSPGYDPPESVRRKISIIHKGRKHSREFIEKRIAPLRGRKRPEHVIAKMRGLAVTAETRAKIGKASLGRKNIWSEQARDNVAKAAYKRSQEGIGAKLRSVLAMEILSRRAANESFASIANDYDVTASAIFYFCKRNIGAKAIG